MLGIKLTAIFIQFLICSVGERQTQPPWCINQHCHGTALCK